MSITVLNVGQNYRIAGGSDKYMFDLSALLCANGHRVVPFAAQHAGNLESEWSAYFPRSVDFSKPGLNDIARYVFSPGARRALNKLLDAVKIDIAHLHIYYGQLSASILKPLRMRGIPIVQTLHEYKLVCPTYKLLSNGNICEKCVGGSFWHALTERCNRGSLARSALSATEAYVSSMLGAVTDVDHFIAVSHFQRSKLIEMGLPAAKISTIHNYTTSALATATPGEGRYFLYFGRLEHEKGVWDLVHAIEKVSGAQLLLAGDGSEKSALIDYASRCQSEQIKVLGFCDQDALRQLIAGAIATCVPSKWYETFGLTIIESFSQCRPVVAADIGGMPEIVADGADGFLFKPGDVSGLAEKLAWLLEHRDIAIEMGQRGQQKLVEEFGPDKHYRRVMDVYQACLRRH